MGWSKQDENKEDEARVVNGAKMGSHWTLQATTDLDFTLSKTECH